MYVAEITAYIVSAPGMPQPPGTACTAIPGHYVVFQGNPDAPLLVSAKLMEDVPHILEILPVEFHEVDSSIEGVRMFNKGELKAEVQEPPIFKADIK